MTESSARSQLEELERDRVSVYVARSKTPWWYFAVIGIATGLMLASNELPHPLLTVGVVLVYAAVVGGLVGWIVRKSGVAPRLRGMPASLLRPVLLFMTVAGVVVLGGSLGATFLDVPWGYLELGVVAGLLFWLGGWGATRVYESRAQRLAHAMGIER